MMREAREEEDEKKTDLMRRRNEIEFFFLFFFSSDFIQIFSSFNTRLQKKERERERQ